MTRLGHVMHLLQDMTSPAHVHNDIHAQVGTFGGETCRDGDDFENWGWSQCPQYAFQHIYDYLQVSVKDNYILTNQITQGLAAGLNNIFGGRPARAGTVVGAQNAAHAYIHELADKVYDFTTFEVQLLDTGHPTAWDEGGGVLKEMFPSLIEATGGRWLINGIGYGDGECGGAGAAAWWLMAYGCTESNPAFNTSLDAGVAAYIENTGGGGGDDFAIPDNLVPAVYPGPWYRARYGTRNNDNNKTMLRIYGDVLYSAAVAYGAGLIQAFLDDAVLPKPVTGAPIARGSSSVRLNGHANAGSESAVAWFEWGTNGSFAHRSDPQSLGNGDEWTELSAVVDGLAPETTYLGRLASSNRFGIRYSTNQVFTTPSYILSSNGTNAWRLTDDSSLSGSTLTYSKDLTVAQQSSATGNGWTLRAISRLTPDVQGSMATIVGYVHGNRRYLFWLDLDSDGALTVRLDGREPQKLTVNAAGATDYHTHEVQFANGQAAYRFNGNTLVNNWTGIAAPAGNPAGRISWGAGSSPGQGEMSFNRVDFIIGASDLAASYYAGTAGNPAEAPEPISQGWTRNVGTSPVSEGPLSPDSESFLTGVETMAASPVTFEGARLNGRADPRGNAAVAWFEWGTGAGYTNATQPVALAAGRTKIDLNEQLNGLVQGEAYHYRLVASNSFGVHFGTRSSFVMPNYLFSGVLPNAWRITDNSDVAGSILTYSDTLEAAQQLAATTNGWRLTATTCVTTNFQDTKSLVFSYGEGSRRFLFWLYHDPTTRELMVELDGVTPHQLTTNRVGATDYHTHEIQYSNGSATYRFDGSLIVTNWIGLPITDRVGRVAWGAESSGGKGEMKVHRVEFAIGGSNTVASYIAGTSGNPAEAPAPTTQGWTISATTGTSRGAVSPDTVPFRPIPLVQTLPAKGIRSSRAELDGSVNTLGQPTSVWFDWGPSVNYGNRTTIQSGNSDGLEKLVSQALSGLQADTTFHFRLVASNAFTMSFGSDQIFRTKGDQPITIASAGLLDEGQFQIQISGPEETTCQILRSVDLVTWTEVGTPTIPSTGQLHFVDESAPGNKAYYRIQMSEP